MRLPKKCCIVMQDLAFHPFLTHPVFTYSHTDAFLGYTSKVHANKIPNVASSQAKINENLANYFL